MTEEELEIQQCLVSIFEELVKEKGVKHSEIIPVGLQYCDELISIVYSNKNPKKKRNQWNTPAIRGSVFKLIYDLLKFHRDDKGFFKNPSYIHEMLDDMVQEGVKLEEYEIASEISIWTARLRSILGTVAQS